MKSKKGKIYIASISHEEKEVRCASTTKKACEWARSRSRMTYYGWKVYLLDGKTLSYHNGTCY